MNAKTRIRKKVLGLHGLHSLHGLQSAVCSLHGLRFGVTARFKGTGRHFESAKVVGHIFAFVPPPKYVH